LYPMSPAKQKVVKNEIDKMLGLGVIEESKSQRKRKQGIRRQ